MRLIVEHILLPCVLILLTYSKVKGSCPAGRFGQRCTGVCHCRPESSGCSPLDGNCYSGQCAIGWTHPPYCQNLCPAGTFGLDCSMSCRCPKGDTCSKINGLCQSGQCLDGWAGPSCQMLLPVLKEPPSVEESPPGRVSLKWRPWDEIRDVGLGPVASYTLEMKQDDTWQKVITMPSHPGVKYYLYTMNNMIPFRLRWFRIRLAMEAGGKSLFNSVAGPETAYFCVNRTGKNGFTPQNKPDKVEESNIKLLNRTSTSLSILWSKGSSNALGYAVDVSFVRSYSSRQTNNVRRFVGAAVNTLLIKGLQPAALYQLSVTFSTTDPKFSTQTWHRQMWTLPASPPKPHPPTIINMTHDSIMLSVQSVGHIDTGPLTAYWIVVEHINDTSQSHLADLLSKTKAGQLLDIRAAKSQGLPYYIALELQQFVGEKIVVIGDNSYGTFYNAPLETHNAYHIWFVVVSQLDGVFSLSWSHINETISLISAINLQAATSPNSGQIAGIVIGTLLLVILLGAACILLALYIKNRHDIQFSFDIASYHHGKTLSETYYGDKSSTRPLPKPFVDKKLFFMNESHDQKEVTFQTSPIYDNGDSIDKFTRPIQSKDLSLHVKQRMGESEFALQEEFKSLRSGLLYSTNVARLPENAIFNRSSHIIPYDKNRVHLERIAPDDNGYINASLVHVENNIPCIITQSPWATTVGAFWRMVWENESEAIIMLMDLIEDEVVYERYWPSHCEERLIDNIKVYQILKQRWANYTVRTFKLSQVDNPTKHLTVRQYQFQSWTKGGVPRNLVAFMDFLELLQRDSNRLRNMIVHCSTGGGRSGMFVAIVTLLRDYKVEERVDVLKRVKKLREERTNMVKTYKQYLFIHRCLADWIDNRQKEIAKEQFSFVCDNILHINKAIPRSILTLEFERIKFPDIASSALTTSMNKRFQSPSCTWALTDEPTASPKRKKMDKLEVVEVDSYLDEKAFLFAQCGSKNVVELFWDYVTKHSINCIVILHKETHFLFGDSSPNTNEIIHVGKYTLTKVIKQQDLGSCIIDDIDIKVKDEDQSSSVRCFRFSNWSNQREVPSARRLVNFLVVVRGWAMYPIRDNNQVLVYTEENGIRAGLFAALWCVMEKLERDNTVDIFNCVRYLRNYYPFTVPNLEQYKLLYKATRELLKRTVSPNEANYTLAFTQDLV